MAGTIFIDIPAGPWIEVSAGIPVGFLTNEGPENLKYVELVTQPLVTQRRGHTLHPRDSISFSIVAPNKLWVIVFKEKNIVAVTPRTTLGVAIDTGLVEDGSKVFLKNDPASGLQGIISEGLPISGVSPEGKLEILASTLARELKVADGETQGQLNSIIKELKILNLLFKLWTDVDIGANDIEG